jgi:hypothetical protein
MQIFNDTTHALRFAFALEHQPDAMSELTSVRMALAELGAAALRNVPWHHDPGALRKQGQDLLHAVNGNLMRYEAATLIARYSRNWEDRRKAVVSLHSYYRTPLARLVDDFQLMERLVTRHYLAERDRGAGWSLAAISEQFGASKERLVRASEVIVNHAEHLEKSALVHLEAVLNKTKEESHA